MNRIFSLIAIFLITAGNAQNGAVWQTISQGKALSAKDLRKHFELNDALYISFNIPYMQQLLSNAPQKFSNQPGVIIEFPNVQGEVEQFEVFENSNFTPDLQAKFPQIRAYVGKGITVRGSVINFSVSPHGVQTVTFYPDQLPTFIEPVNITATGYAVFGYDNKVFGREPFKCATPESVFDPNFSSTTGGASNKADNKKYKTLKLALSCTGEYANFFGADAVTPDASLVLTGMNATMTRVNGVMERDLAVHLNMIDNTSLIFFDPNTDPYSDAANMNNWNQELQSTISSNIATNVYDIGHLFGATGGGGNAGCIGCVCVAPTTNTPLGKGSGITAPGQGGPQGDSYDIDFVAHEMGHQLGGNHTFTYANEGSGVQTEPASGTTIMAYAGVTGNYDIQLHSDVLYSSKSIAQIQQNLNTKICPVSVTMTNVTPTANAGADYTIPKSTPFMLTGTGADADANDVLTYVWEQIDQGSSSTTGNSSRCLGTKATGPNFRTFPVKSTPVRYFPDLTKVFSNILLLTTTNNTSNYESLSSVGRALNFSFTVRDNVAGGGQTKQDFMKVTVDATKGPLTVNSQNTAGIIYTGGTTQTVTWLVNSTDALSANVDILLGTPIGSTTTFSYVLATGVPNNGSAQVVMPNITANTCRIMVKASTNIFFHVNPNNFKITPSLGTIDFNFADFSLFPNPNNGAFNLRFTPDSSDNVAITIQDLRGRTLYQKSYDHTGFFNEEIALNATVESGIYLVSIENGSKKMTRKIVKN
ncbi:MAG: propanediol utilization protein [Flavobacterium sp. BFFFF2]|nr:MAG: propanediol utilization protein [Flavobacterium sp. BFFFF2]